MRGADSRIEHVKAEHDQADRPVTDEKVDADQIGRVEEQNEAEGDQKNGSGGKSALGGTDIEQAGELLNRGAVAAVARRVEGFEGHVENPCADQQTEQCLKGPVDRVRQAYQKAEDNGVNQPFRVLSVVDCAHARKEAEEHREHRM